jgi:hypothetical protein
MAKAGDSFVTKDLIYVFKTEQDCAQWLVIRAKPDGGPAMQQMIDSGKMTAIPAGSEVTVVSVGSNGIDKIKLKGYPMDLFTPSLVGFQPSK